MRYINKIKLNYGLNNIRGNKNKPTIFHFIEMYVIGHKFTYINVFLSENIDFKQIKCAHRLKHLPRVCPSLLWKQQN